MQYTPRKILVTGGAGFIGSHFINYMHMRNPDISIVNVDKLSYAANIECLSRMTRMPHYHFVQADIADAVAMQTVLRNYQIDTIVNFAAETHVDNSIQSPQVFIQTNVVGTQVLLHEALQFWREKFNLDQQCCRFHHISTDEVYGSIAAGAPAFTEDSPYRPNSPYSASKAASDHLVRAYYKTYGLPISLSNCSNNFGINQHAEKFIPVVIRCCLERKPIPIYKDGSNIRDWLDVHDHCKAIDLILHGGMVGCHYNIGGDNELNNLEVAQAICAKADELFPDYAPHSRLITFVRDRLGHDWRYAIDSSLIKNTLGWYPEKKLFDQLEALILATIEMNSSFSHREIMTGEKCFD